MATNDTEIYAVFMRRHIGFKYPDVVMQVVGLKEWPILISKYHTIVNFIGFKLSVLKGCDLVY